MQSTEHHLRHTHRIRIVLFLLRAVVVLVAACGVYQSIDALHRIEVVEETRDYWQRREGFLRSLGIHLPGMYDR